MDENNLNSQQVQDEARGNANKRFLADTSPEVGNERTFGKTKVGDLNVDDLRMIMKESNKEVLEKLTTLSVDVENIKEENKILKQEVEVLKADKEIDRKRISQLEEQLKSKNLIFKGLNAKTSVSAVVSKICFEKLKLPQTAKIIYTRKLYERDGKMAVLVEMDSAQSVQDALRNAKKLAGTSIYVEKDLNVDKQQDKRVMLQMKKDIVAVSSVHRVAVMSDRIRIKDKWLRWTKDRKLVCGQQDGYDILKELYKNHVDQININYNTLLEKSISKN